MALTENTYTGDGSTVLFSFTFPYLDITDIRVSLNGTNTTAYTLQNATTVRFNTAPANGAKVRLYRKTNNDILKSEFYPGSAIRAQDLNDDFTQVLYTTQEATVTVDESAAKSDAAMLAAGAAVITSDEAKATAEGAAMVAGVAIQKADTAVADSTYATSTANQADTKATSALAAVSNAVRYTVIQNVAAIPGSPADETYIEVTDSTGIESFSPLLDIPNGFVGDPGLTVKLRYTTTGNTWRWLGYTASNSEKRYAPLDSPRFTGNVSFPAGVVTSDGKLGVGTANPSEVLEVAGNIALSANPGSFRVFGAGLSSNTTVVLQAGGVSGLGGNIELDRSGDIVYDGINHRFRSLDGTAERVRITSEGKVGIGTSSPSQQLHVAGIARIGANDTTDASLEIGAGATGNRSAYIDFVGDTTWTDYGLRILRGNLGANSDSIIAHKGTGNLNLICEEAGSISLSTGGQERLRITSTGVVQLAAGSYIEGYMKSNIALLPALP